MNFALGGWKCPAAAAGLAELCNLCAALSGYFPPRKMIQGEGILQKAPSLSTEQTPVLSSSLLTGPALSGGVKGRGEASAGSGYPGTVHRAERESNTPHLGLTGPGFWFIGHTDFPPPFGG